MTNEQRINLLTAALRWYASPTTWAHRSTSPPSRAELDRGDRARLALVAVGVDVEAGGGGVSAETAVKGTLPGATPGGHAGAGAGVPYNIPSSLTNTAKAPILEGGFWGNYRSGVQKNLGLEKQE